MNADQFLARLDSIEPIDLPMDELATAVGPCKIWHRADRYAHMRLDTDDGITQIRVHRLVYIMQHGPIDRDLHIDHLCRHRGCVEVTHLEPVTPRENTLRGARMRRSEVTCCPGCGSPDGKMMPHIKAKPEGTWRWICRPCQRRRDEKRRAA